MVRTLALQASVWMMCSELVSTTSEISGSWRAKNQLVELLSSSRQSPGDKLQRAFGDARLLLRRLIAALAEGLP